MKLLEELKALLHEAEKDADAFFSRNNKAAGTRLHKRMQQVKVQAQAVRKAVSTQKNAA